MAMGVGQTVIRRTRGVGVALALASVALAGGCAGYSTYPKVRAWPWRM